MGGTRTKTPQITQELGSQLQTKAVLNRAWLILL